MVEGKEMYKIEVRSVRNVRFVVLTRIKVFITSMILKTRSNGVGKNGIPQMWRQRPGISMHLTNRG